MKSCPHCGTPMSNPRRVQCGAAECERLARNARQRAYFDAKKAELGERYEERYKDRQRGPRIEQRCQWCGAAFRKRILVRSCGPACQAKLKDRAHSRARGAATRRAKALERLDKSAQGTRGAGPFVSGPCGRCGSLFTARWSNHQPGFCTRACMRAEVRARRRAREAGCKVTDGRRYTTYQRDEWNCQLCNEPVDREQVVPHPRAATIDHIVPLARGGAHEPANWQTAHFMCNSTKRDAEYVSDAA